MPLIKRYRVTQTRVVDVAANDEAGALTVANIAFTTNGKVAEHDEPWGYATLPPEVHSVEVARR